jgi:D-alanyl-D-alanine carboxypeptidase
MRTPMTLLAAVVTLLAGASARADRVIDPYPETAEETYQEPAVDDLTPRAAVGYRGGRKAAIQVVTINYEEIELATGKAFLEMREAARADGIELWFYSGYRTMEQQRWLYQKYKKGWGHKAARPGHSNHQMGRAMDMWIGEPGTFAWLEANARRFGFKRTVPGEPWHWEYVKKPKKAKARKKKPRR